MLFQASLAVWARVLMSHGCAVLLVGLATVVVHVVSDSRVAVRRIIVVFFGQFRGGDRLLILLLVLLIHHEHLLARFGSFRESSGSL